MASDQLYSRQNYAYGETVTAQLQQMNVHIVGDAAHGGVYFEIAKNLLLSGLRHLTLENTIPSHPISVERMRESCYALSSDAPGNCPIMEGLPFLRSLNASARISVQHTKLTRGGDEVSDDEDASFWAKVDVLIVTAGRSHWPQWNAVCREHGVWFLGATVDGFAGIVWQDPGEAHTVWDIDGEARAQMPVMSSQISDEGGAVILQLDETDLRQSALQTGNEICVVGDPASVRYRVLSTTTDGITLQSDVPEEDVVRFQEAYIEPLPMQTRVHGVALSNYLSMTMEKSSSLDLNSYAKGHDGLSALWERFWGSGVQRDHEDIGWYPLCCHIGGVAAQEIIKRSGKFVPRVGCYFADVFELESAHRSGELCEAISSSHILVIGAGALGCETLKNLVMLGAGTIEIVDMDSIELSNLSRQFLFRPEDIGKPKAEIAVQRVLHQRPTSSRVTHRNVIADDSTMHSFQWSEYTAVIGAVDNVEARRWIDAMCVWHKIPFLDAGTLGVKANTQIVYPNLTQTYADSRDPEVRNVPVCTIKQYPYQIEHCVHWALELFASTFEETAHSPLDDAKATDVEESGMDAKQRASHYVDKWFIKSIETVRKAHPKDATNEDGTPFWNGGKRRYPRTLVEWIGVDEERESLRTTLIERTTHLLELTPPPVFEKDNNMHIEWLQLASSLRAICYDIPSCEFAQCKQIAGNIAPAVASVTATAVGLLIDELCKVMLRVELTKCYNAYLNLGINLVLLSEPMPPLQQCSKEYDEVLGSPVRAIPDGFNCWDRIHIDHSDVHTIEDVKKWVETQYNITVTSIYGVGGQILYSDLTHDDAHARSQALTQYASPLSQWERRVYTSHLGRIVAQLTIDGEGLDDDEVVVMPTFAFTLAPAHQTVVT